MLLALLVLAVLAVAQSVCSRGKAKDGAPKRKAKRQQSELVSQCDEDEEVGGDEDDEDDEDEGDSDDEQNDARRAAPPRKHAKSKATTKARSSKGRGART